MELFDSVGRPDLSAICALPLFRGISPGELAGLVPRLVFTNETFRRGELIIRCGQMIDRVFILTGGVACADMLALQTAGKTAGAPAPQKPETNDMGRFGEGEVLGLEAVFSYRGSSPSDIIADSSTCGVATITLTPLLEGPLARRFIENWAALLSDRYVRTIYWVRVLAQRSLRAKILTFAYIMGNRDNSNSFEMRMTQDEFASYLRVARQSLNRELKALKREGFLSIEGRKYTLLRQPDNWRSRGPAHAHVESKHIGEGESSGH